MTAQVLFLDVFFSKKTRILMPLSMCSILKKAYIDKLVHVVIQYSNTYHSTTKMKPVDRKSSTYTDFNKESLW